MSPTAGVAMRQGSHKKNEEEAARRLTAENDELRTEWTATKAALYKEREAAAEARREAELHAAAAREQLKSEEKEKAAAREECARVEGELGTMRQLHDTLQLQLRERTAAAAVGGAAGSGLPEELAAARRALKTAEVR